MKRIFVILLSITLIFAAHPARAGQYHLTLAQKMVNITGHPVSKLTINGTIPGPTLHFTDGEHVVIHVTNKTDEPASIHWHGFLLPADMDGVPGFNGFHGIMPGKTFTYHFKVRQTGTYWYHSHSLFQEQNGLYGGIFISPKGKDPIKTNHDYVVVLSDFTDTPGRAVMDNLKMNSDYYNYARQTLGDFFDKVRKDGFKKAWDQSSLWWKMRMSPTDLTDVSGYTFLMNGKTPKQNWTGLFKPGQRVRLRIINASSMSFFDVRIPGLKMTVVAADGQDVAPVKVDELRIGVAETYDVIVTPTNDKAYTIAAESIDRTGFALGTLAPHEGMHGPAPSPRPRELLTMKDMGGMDMGNMKMPMKDMSSMNMGGMNHMSQKSMKSGWADAGTPPGMKMLSYADLRYAGIQKDTRPPDRTIDMVLGGNMERYIWTINGKRFRDAKPIRLKYNERVRLRFINKTMMAHPMHLHGMFFQLENGQPPDKMPNKHTIIIPPGGTYSVLLTANAPGEWPLHCHLLYHMAGGMMRRIIVASPDSAHQTKNKGGQSYAVNDALPTGQHFPNIYHVFRLETDYGAGRHGSVASWDWRGWIGSDYNKLWLRTEGEKTNGKTQQEEFWALYSRNIAPFWDAQAGIRYDTTPVHTTYLAVGLNGLAPYYFDTEAHLFVSNDGDVTARLREENDFLITQRLITQPYVEVNLSAQPVARLDTGAGLTDGTIGLQTRYEMTRKFAPYIDIRYERKFGQTAAIARSNGESDNDIITAIGLRLMF